MTEQAIKSIVDTLTTEEKVSLLSGKDFWQTRDISEKGIESIWLSDGPHGLRKEDMAHASENGGHSVKATCLPPAVGLACSWDETLLNDVGKAIAEECKAHGVSVILGPGANIKRSPKCGRNFEYFSEEPVLAGKLAAAMIRGAEAEGIGTSLKHFAANNQETLRMSISSEIDERALNEIYLKPFEIAVKEGKPSTVMCSYNRVNGTYSSENKHLLTDKLRNEWGFDGLVMSDWGAVSDRAKGVDAGLDLEMPSSKGFCNGDVISALQNGTLSMAAVDKACVNVIKLADKLKQTERTACDMAQHHALAVKALEKSAVLMKNDDNILPLSHGENVAFIGAMAGTEGRYQGCGSSIVNPANRVDFLTAYKSAAKKYALFAKGYNVNDNKPNIRLETEALKLAKKADKVVCFLGLSDIYETECYDRDTMQLPQNQQHLLKALIMLNKNIVVVLTAGSAVTMPWINDVKAVLYTALCGEGGEAVYNLLYGNANPCGKLAETWPLHYADTPCAKHWPMGPRYVSYNESIYVGYRYYEKAGKNVLFPFGHGLSYTSFEYTNIKLNKTALAKGEALEAEVTMKNTGEVDGEEVVQLYVGHNASAAYQPVRELKAFDCVSLKAGESKTVTLQVPYNYFAFYNVTSHSFVTEKGTYTINIGVQNNLSAQIEIDGEQVQLETQYSSKGAYGDIKNNDFTDEDFATIHKCSYPNNDVPQKGDFDITTPIGQMAQSSALAHRIMRFAQSVTAPHMHFSTNAAVNKKAVEKCVEYLPFKNLGMQSGGAISPKMIKILFSICNRKK